MRESYIESKFVKYCKRIGCKTYKLNGDGDKGKPDRLVICPDGFIFFIEFKAPDKKLRPLQVLEKERLEALGCLYFVADQPGQAEGYLDEVLAA